MKLFPIQLSISLFATVQENQLIESLLAETRAQLEQMQDVNSCYGKQDHGQSNKGIQSCDQVHPLDCRQLGALKLAMHRGLSPLHG